MYSTMDHHPVCISYNTTQLYDPQSEPADALIGLYDFPIDFSIDSLFFDQPPPLMDDLFMMSYINAEPAELPTDYDLQYRCPKRPRSCCSDCLLEFAAPAKCNGEKREGAPPLSAQSVAARERRKRISEKRQELGRLIPAGNKMNTAEMFHAAYKYVKFLQAQVGILALMAGASMQQEMSDKSEDLRMLLKSQGVHEKLSVEGRCIVPMEMVEELAKDAQIKSSTSLSRDLNRIIRSTS